MKRIVVLVLAFGLLAALLSACGTMSPSPSPKTSPSANVSPSINPTVSPSPEVSPSPAVSSSPETSPTVSVTPSADVSAGGLEGDVIIALSALVEQARGKLSGDNALPNSFEEALTAEKSQIMLGLTPEQLTTYADEAAVSQSMFGFGYMSALVKCKDAAAAKEVKKLIAENFDEAAIWICAIPEECSVVDYEQYVLLGVAPVATCTALREAFAGMADGALGETDRFYIRA